MDPKNKKIIVIAVVAAIVLAIIYFVLIKKSPDETTMVGAVTPATFPLKKGSRGKEVEQLQSYLLKTYGAQFPISGIDGIWGDETEANVQKWLKKDNVSKESYDKWGLDAIKTTVFK